MCVSIVFGVNIDNGRIAGFAERIEELGRLYEYGIGIGRESLPSGAENATFEVLSEPPVIFEVHDLPEPHCACDIDDDIRIAAKSGRKSKFFDFVREVQTYRGVRFLAILFYQEELPNRDNVRKQTGSHEEFVELLNRWNTWQVEGFEPTRRSYYIAEASPLLFTFTNNGQSL